MRRIANIYFILVPIIGMFFAAIGIHWALEPWFQFVVRMLFVVAILMPLGMFYKPPKIKA